MAKKSVPKPTNPTKPKATGEFMFSGYSSIGLVCPICYVMVPKKTWHHCRQVVS